MVSRLPEPTTDPDTGTPHPKRRRRRLRVRKLPVSVFPTLLTLGNVLCGFMAIFYASRTEHTDFPFDWTPLTFASIAIFMGMLFDGLDGRVARMTNSTSAFGEQLDSMADMVTFGVAPAFIAIQLVEAGVPYISDSADHFFGRATLIIAMIYVACAALRLARYTVAASEKHSIDPSVFTGLPSPGAAGTVASLALLHQHVLYGIDAIPADSWIVEAARIGMVAVMLLTALAMVSKLPYTHVMNRYLRDRAKVGTVAMYVIVTLLLFIVPQWTLAFGFAGYALSAPAWWAWRSLSHQAR